MQIPTHFQILFQTKKKYAQNYCATVPGFYIIIFAYSSRKKENKTKTKGILYVESVDSILVMDSISIELL